MRQASGSLVKREQQVGVHRLAAGRRAMSAQQRAIATRRSRWRTMRHRCSMTPWSYSREHRRQRDHLVGRGQVRRYGLALVVGVDVELRGREPERAFAHRLASTNACIAHDLVVGRRAFARRRAHHPAPHRGVPDVDRDVDADASVEAVEEVADDAAARSRRLRCSASADMPSTLASIRTSQSRSPGLDGASVKPQLPVSTVVTPCHDDGDAVGSK